MQVVKLKYFDEFRCIGPKCPDSCCKNWSISLSKREYLNYKKMDCSSELKTVISKAFSRIKGNPDESYAVMKLTESGSCPFFREDGLCMIQAEKGEQFLSFTCTVFPRLTFMVGRDVCACACTTNCPYVVEMLMSYSDGLEIVEENYDRTNKYINEGKLSYYNTPSSWKGFPYYWLIKNTGIYILQNRNFTISERLLILGFFFKKADEYVSNLEEDKINKLAKMVLDNSICKEISDGLKTHQTKEEQASKVINNFSRMFSASLNGMNPEVKRLYKIASDKIVLDISSGENEKAFITWDTERYMQGNMLYEKIESERPYIIENILVNLLFTQPLHLGIWANFFTLTIFYNTLKICVPAFLNDNWNDKDLAVAITYTSKIVLNTHFADRGVVSDFITNNSFDLPHAAFLIS